MSNYTKENVVPDIRKASDFDVAMKDAFSNFTSATNSEVEYIMVNPKQGVNAMNSNADYYSNFFGRRKTCKSQGLSGAEMRACKKQLRQAGWKKGQPIPDSISPNTSTLTPADMTDPSLNPDSTSKTTSTGMSTGMKWGLGIGGVLLAVGIGFAIVKMKPKAVATVIPSPKA